MTLQTYSSPKVDKFVQEWHVSHNYHYWQLNTKTVVDKCLPLITNVHFISDKNCCGCSNILKKIMKLDYANPLENLEQKIFTLVAAFSFCWCCWISSVKYILWEFSFANPIFPQACGWLQIDNLNIPRVYIHGSWQKCLFLSILIPPAG